MGDQLPSGNTCFDCIHVGRCCSLHALNTPLGKSACIFSPSQFEQNPGLLLGARSLADWIDEDQEKGESI
jgi:hypothetical protein